MKVYFSNGQAQVIDYYHPKISEDIYLDKSVVYQLRERKWLDEEILEELEFKIYSNQKAYCLYEWQIATPIPVTKHPGTIASICPDIHGQIMIQEIDDKKIYICKY
jgi:hypothetical protein